MEGIRLTTGAWDAVAGSCRGVRDAVFVQEQKVPGELEHDGKDAECLHVLALLQNGRPIGTGRLLADGHIGRMAVLPDWRGQGVGGAMLALLIEEARERGHVTVALNAQVSALGFYQGFGFEAVGDRFIEAGLSHQAMALRL
jgi:predicted GNAT family N-acyltransferase